MNCSLRYSIFSTLVLLVLITGFHAGFAQPLKPVYFDEVIEKRLSNGNPKAEWNFEKFCPVSTNVIALRVLQSYGSMFVASDAVKLPSSCVQNGESDVLKFQRDIQKKQLDINGVRIDLQTGAATALESAIAEASVVGLTIRPLDGSIAGGRSYGDTLMLWNSRVFPGMDFWMRRGRLSQADRDSIAMLDITGKVGKVLEWESRGMFFSTDRTRSILTSVAPPGTSQHLALIAFDIEESWNATVRTILNRNGWFQTVVDDPAHFTFLGYPESELPARGLMAVSKGGRVYWVPNLPPTLASLKSTN